MLIKPACLVGLWALAPDSAALAPLRRGDIPRTADYRHTANDSAVLQAVLDHGPVARSTALSLAV